MYYFEAHYINMVKGAEITKKICFDGQFFTDRDCYLYAMARAYDMAEEDEMFLSLEVMAY